MSKYLFTSESVTEGHPDKVADQVSDALLDAFLKEDADSRVAIETLAKSGNIIVAGEVTTEGYVDTHKVIRDTIKEIGYTKSEYGFDHQSCGIMDNITEQSPEISQGVSEGKGLFKEQGAGDQGMMFGYASDETKELMPLTISLAHKLAKQLTKVRKDNTLSYLRPDGKTQVTVEYEDDQPKWVDTVVIAAQHDEDVSHEKVQEDVIEHVIKPVCGEWLDNNTKFYVNATGKFIIGGPVADAGLTGRKIIVDTYGGWGAHGGGCFSGKDPSKVDRSAAYAARYIAKNIVAAGLAKRCLVQLAYVIGKAEPLSVYINTYKTGKIDDEMIVELIRKHFPLKPKDIIDHFDLKRPMYKKTAAYGHFGRKSLPWEKVDKVDELKHVLLV